MFRVCALFVPAVCRYGRQLIDADDSCRSLLSSNQFDFMAPKVRQIDTLARFIELFRTISFNDDAN